MTTPRSSTGPADAAFESHRAVLLAVAYRMCGSRQDAEDVVQDAWLRWFGRDEEPEHTRAWLVRVVTNLCLDRLKRAHAQREVYVGPWLPEPVRAEPALQAFIAACGTGDPEAVMAMLTDDVQAVSDGGGVVPGAGTRPVSGRRNVARLIVGLLQKYGPELTFAAESINGQPALVARVGGTVVNAVCFEWADGRVRSIYSVLNPAKLQALA